MEKNELTFGSLVELAANESNLNVNLVNKVIEFTKYYDEECDGGKFHQAMIVGIAWYVTEMNVCEGFNCSFTRKSLWYDYKRICEAYDWIYTKGHRSVFIPSKEEFDKAWRRIKKACEKIGDREYILLSLTANQYVGDVVDLYF